MIFGSSAQGRRTSSSSSEATKASPSVLASTVCWYSISSQIHSGPLASAVNEVAAFLRALSPVRRSNPPSSSPKPARSGHWC